MTRGQSRTHGQNSMLGTKILLALGNEFDAVGPDVPRERVVEKMFTTPEEQVALALLMKRVASTANEIAEFYGIKNMRILAVLDAAGPEVTNDVIGTQYTAFDERFK